MDQSQFNNKDDLAIIQAIFKSPNKAKSFIDGFKPAIIGGGLCVILSLPFVNGVLENCGCKTPSMVYGIKFLIFVIAFYILTSKKNNEEE